MSDGINDGLGGHRTWQQLFDDWQEQCRFSQSKVDECNALRAQVAALRADVEAAKRERDVFAKSRDEWMARCQEKSNEKVEAIWTQHAAEAREAALRGALAALLDAVDWQTGACTITEMVGSVLPSVLLSRARAALSAPEGQPAAAPHFFDKRAADALAREVQKLIDRKVLDARSPAADALLDYCNPGPNETVAGVLAEGQPAAPGVRWTVEKVVHEAHRAVEDAIGEYNRQAGSLQVGREAMCAAYSALKLVEEGARALAEGQPAASAPDGEEPCGCSALRDEHGGPYGEGACARTGCEEFRAATEWSAAPAPEPAASAPVWMDSDVTKVCAACGEPCGPRVGYHHKPGCANGPAAPAPAAAPDPEVDDG